jgi:F420-non-reducing hydrogenase iron-sulfur subunit
MRTLIVAFCCNYCSYEAADRAGANRKSYPEDLRIIRVPCSGRVEPEFIVKAFESGADGVLILGCHLGNCHFKVGNYKTYRRYLLLRDIFKSAGIEEERIRLEWVGASEEDKFVRISTEFAEKIRKLGKFGGAIGCRE